ncbi:hypothetical protein ACQEVZ_33255 [Dactylosporangium sp. CA-152071]|uniref:hypothetical protein n=1 Tax=Dactylosporangium sp. CA-152071 TaxID=3239933 RepID=UPI003D940A55
MDGDHLPYPARRGLQAARALAGAADGTLAATLAALRAGERHEREVALFMALVGRDRRAVLAALTDEDPHIRRSALLAWAGSAETAPEPVARVVADAPADTRVRLYRRIRVRGRTDLAEALVDPVRARFGDAEAAALLPACGEATVARLLPQLAHVLGDRAALTRRHPRACLDQAERELAALPEAARGPWWARHGAGVLAAAPALPHRVLELLERYGPRESLPSPLRAYGVLTAADPLLVLALLTRPSRAAWLARTALPRAVLSRLGRLPVAGLVGLARRLRGHGPALARLLAAVPPHDRAELFTRAMSDVDRSRSLPEADVHRVLPAGLRVAEARRALTLDAVRQSEALTLAYTAHLPWAEAEEPLLAATRRARAEDRVTAWQLLIRCAARGKDPAAVLAATHHLLRLRNEQDPVRAAALWSLADVRPALLRPELVEPLEQVVADVVQARDTSPMALGRLSDLAVLVLRERFDSPVLVRWALHTFQRLLGDDRVPRLGDLPRLRRGQETQAFEAVRGWVRLGAERAKFEPLFAIARALGERAWRLPDLQSMLERATRRGNLAGVARTAVDLWLADPRHRAERVEAVLREDPSAIALPAVWRAVCARRGDLLDAALTGPPPTGRFVPAGVRWVPPRPVHLRRWLPHQHRAYVERQAEVVRDVGATPQARAAALRDAAPVPVHGEALVLEWVDAGDVVLAEAALAALAWTDRPAAALPVLLRHVGDDRARVVVAAAGRVSRFTPPSVLLAALDPALGKVTARKVTARKEAVRLLAVRSVPGAADTLWRLWQDPGLHRSVRVAIVAAARQRAGDPAMWRILRAAGADRDRDSGRDELGVLLAASPWAVPVPLRGDYAALVAAAAAGPDKHAATWAWAILPDWAPWLADVTGAVVSRLTDLDDRIVWRPVVRALAGLVDTGLGEAPLVAAVRALAAAGTDASDTARDAARRRVEAIVDAVVAWSDRAAHDAAGRDAAGAAGRALSTVDGYVPAAATLLVEAADLADPATGWLDGVRRLTADRPVLAARLAGRAGRRLERPAAEPGTTLAIAARLATGDGLADGLFGLAYAARGGDLGWPEPWRDVVATLRRHPVAEVRDAALALSTDPTVDQ